MAKVETGSWLFNTDETEAEGEGKHAVMLKHQVVAAHGYCRGRGAEATLNRPRPGDAIYFFRAGFGIIARAVATDTFSSETHAVFGAEDEYSRPVEELQILPDTGPVTVAEIKDETDYQIPYRQIMARIPNELAVEYLNRRFGGVRRKPAQPRTKTDGGSFQPDPEQRQRVEKAAVRFVSKVYEKRKWVVKSVETENVGYDLHCTKADLVECVEVKGTSGSDQRFVITVNELNKAKTDSRFVLYVVTNVLHKPVAHKYSGRQVIDQFALQPIQFRAVKKDERKACSRQVTHQSTMN